MERMLSEAKGPVMNQAFFFFFCFPVEVGANIGARRATLDDWEELTRALCETAIDFTVFSARLHCSGPSGSCLVSNNKHTWGLSKPQSNPQGAFQSIWPSRALIFFTLAFTLQHLQSHGLCCPLGNEALNTYRDDAICAHYLGVL